MAPPQKKPKRKNFQKSLPKTIDMTESPARKIKGPLNSSSKTKKKKASLKKKKSLRPQSTKLNIKSAHLPCTKPLILFSKENNFTVDMS